MCIGVLETIQSYLYFIDVSWHLDSVGKGGSDSLWFNPLGLIGIGVFGIDFPEDFPRQVIHSLWEYRCFVIYLFVYNSLV